MGSKKEHIRLAADGRYDKSKIIMIGDAPGDMKAARANGALFFPIDPGREETSWEHFFTESADKFRKGEYTADYEAELVAEFQKLLPSTPPWKH
jgi:phosphoglycolate phosphatase-like HAD superfamily hydrolase